MPPNSQADNLLLDKRPSQYISVSASASALALAPGLTTCTRTRGCPGSEIPGYASVYRRHVDQQTAVLQWGVQMQSRDWSNGPSAQNCGLTVFLFACPARKRQFLNVMMCHTPIMHLSKTMGFFLQPLQSILVA